MSEYRRVYLPGACFFFTVVTHQRRNLFAREQNIHRLREAFRRVKQKQPFTIDAIVVLPDHIHSVWRLPDEDSNYSLRWRLIKHFFAIGMRTDINHRGEKQVWQRRFWEHTIRDESDWRNHVDYVHYNPVRHGCTDSPAMWRYSSFSQAVKKGWYEEGWGCSSPGNVDGMDLE